MRYIPAASLTELPKRLDYTISFLGFTPEDGKSIQASGPLIVPILQDVLDGIYTKLLSYDITAKAFVPKTVDDPEHSTEPARPEDLTLEHGHIGRQMNFLRNYLTKIVTNTDWNPDSKLFLYMNQVGVMHTGAPGFKYREKKPEVRVEYMHMGLLLGHVVDMLMDAVFKMDQVDVQTKGVVLRAWNKLMWLQNDLFARQYVVDRQTEERPAGIAHVNGNL